MNERRIPVRLLAALSLALPASMFASPLHAQDPDAARAIQELARKIDEQMKEIDRLLLETSKQKGGEAKAPPKESLSRTREQSQIVEKSIDELIQKLNQMKQQSSSSSSSDSQDQQKSDEKQDEQQKQLQQQKQQQKQLQLNKLQQQQKKIKKTRNNLSYSLKASFKGLFLCHNLFNDFR